MWNGYLRYFVNGAYLDNDIENQSLLCAKIMHRHLVQEIVTLSIRVKLLPCPERE